MFFQRCIRFLLTILYTCLGQGELGYCDICIHIDRYISIPEFFSIYIFLWSRCKKGVTQINPIIAIYPVVRTMVVRLTCLSDYSRGAPHVGLLPTIKLNVIRWPRVSFSISKYGLNRGIEPNGVAFFLRASYLDFRNPLVPLTPHFPISHWTTGPSCWCPNHAERWKAVHECKGHVYYKGNPEKWCTWWMIR